MQILSDSPPQDQPVTGRKLLDAACEFVAFVEGWQVRPHEPTFHDLGHWLETNHPELSGHACAVWRLMSIADAKCRFVTRRTIGGAR